MPRKIAIMMSWYLRLGKTSLIVDWEDLKAEMVHEETRAG